MNINWKQRLSKIKDFEAVKKSAEQLSGGTVPDAQYRAKLTSAELAESQGSGREQINMFMEITEGEFQGHSISSFPGLDEEKSLPFTIAMLRNLGFEIEEPEQIVDAVDSLSSELPELIVRVKKGFTNIISRADGSEGVQDGEQQDIVAEEGVAEEPAAIEVGSEVLFNWKGETLEGKVKEIDDVNQKIKVSSGGKLYPCKAEDVELKGEEVVAEEDPVEEDPQEEPLEEEAPKPKVIKKVVKPAPKKVIKKKR